MATQRLVVMTTSSNNSRLSWQLNGGRASSSAELFEESIGKDVISHVEEYSAFYAGDTYTQIALSIKLKLCKTSSEKQRHFNLNFGMPSLTCETFIEIPPLRNYCQNNLK